MVNLMTHKGRAHPWNFNSIPLSEMGSVQLEFTYLSHHTKNPIYAQKASIGIEILSKKTPNEGNSKYKLDGLFPVYVSPETGDFNNDKVTFGALGDSFYEYLIKYYILTNRKEKMHLQMYERAINSMQKYLVKQTSNQSLTYIGYREHDRFIPEMDHLVCFVPGMLFLGAKEGIYNLFN